MYIYIYIYFTFQLILYLLLLLSQTNNCGPFDFELTRVDSIRSVEAKIGKSFNEHKH